MKINCVIGPFLPIPPIRGGAVERIFLAVCEEFAKRGHEVTMVSRRFPGLANEEIVDGVRHLRVPSNDAPSNRVLYRLLDLKYALTASKALPRADVTITHSVSLPLLIPKARAGKIYVSVGRYPKGHMGIYKRADRLQGVSSFVTEAIKQQSPSVAHLAKTVPNCLSQVFSEAVAEGRGPRLKQILYVGRIAREKGIDLLIDAFARLKQTDTQWTLKIVGPHEVNQGGDGAAFLEELRSRAGAAIRDIDFAGPVYEELKLKEVMQKADVFVYPSVATTGESFGLAPLEAMACGCAVVVSNLECFRDYLVDGANGVAFDHTDRTGDSLAGTLQRLTEKAEVRDALAAGGLVTARKYSPQSVADLFLKDFETLVAR
ncbi:Glycosyltransferase involved in cell wall bisynthesis [Rhizobium sp. RU35A]|uniref:glycosyltransferase family 4 protein n=1 Tax=Rhizobium sp. RU35A TaxID=1907414 RepID=UPI0009565044|nr:glycosyltransferase family 4 protein [Rhizobium sp. RU35A]SIQ00594.1 Glycosyltransferase involved in cell wall bisynthesis [Rhizobium sp. RU35A]